MKQHLTIITAAIVLSLISLHASGASDPRTSNNSTKAESRGYDYDRSETQPATGPLDLSMYARIREEGFSHSHIMEYASALFDGIGPRLTGSPIHQHEYAAL